MKVVGHQYVLHKSTAGKNRNYIVNVQSGTGFFVGRFSPGGKWSPVVSTTNVADGKWHYLTQTYDKKSDKVLVYVDGVLEKERKMGAPLQPMRGCSASAEDQSILSLSPAVSTKY